VSDGHDTTSSRGHWGSRWGFILAAAGSAVGLGNIWKFPYITGENGGGLFVLIYLACIAFVGLPIMLAEIMIGRAAQKQPVGAFRKLQGKDTSWTVVGWFGIVAGFIILSYYIVVAGWSMDFALKSVLNFTEPVEKVATIEAKSFRSTSSDEELRSYLAQIRSKHEARDEINSIRRSVRPSVWEKHSIWQEVLKTNPSRSYSEDPELSEAIPLAQIKVAEIAEVQQQALAEAMDHYQQMDLQELADEAESSKRREIIAAKVGAIFGATASDGWTSSFWATLFMMITIIIVAGGISRGIERACKVLMPVLIALILVMVIYGVFQPGFEAAVRFVFEPDASKLRPSGVLEALGHAFFTLSLGMGCMLTYGSYQKTKLGIGKTTLMIALFDTVIALLACMMIFPIIFTYGQEPSAGPGLVFISMPLAFAEMGAGGLLLAIMFFVLLVFAALTSAVSLLEVACSYLIDEQGWNRKKAAVTVGIACLAFGLPSAFAMDSGFLLDSWESGYNKNFFDTMDHLATNWLLPLGGLLIAIYAGWVMPARLRAAEVEDMSPVLVGGWLLLIRFVAPALVLVVLAQKIGILDINELFG
jgi:NSS family neurotransmitter:Na+ symporter